MWRPSFVWRSHGGFGIDSGPKSGRFWPKLRRLGRAPPDLVPTSRGATAALGAQTVDLRITPGHFLPDQPTVCLTHQLPPQNIPSGPSDRLRSSDWSAPVAAVQVRSLRSRNGFLE